MLFVSIETHTLDFLMCKMAVKIVANLPRPLGVLDALILVKLVEQFLASGKHCGRTQAFVLK